MNRAACVLKMGHTINITPSSSMHQMYFWTVLSSALLSVYGEVYTWGWKECVPSGKGIGDHSDQQTGEIPEKDDRHSGFPHDQGDVSKYLNLSRVSFN